MISPSFSQVNQATGLKSKAGRLQETAAELLTKAKVAKEDAAALKAQYYKTMDDYSKAVESIDTATQKAQAILDQMNAQSLVLAQVYVACDQLAGWSN
jgi:septal ring factor EnvC (AmiA/AmiB activator)